MSRLIDRILVRLEPFRASLIDPGLFQQLTYEALRKDFPGLSEKEFQRRLLATSALTRAGEPVAIKRFDTKALDGVPILLACTYHRYQ
jgi:hypothetical protein